MEGSETKAWRVGCALLGASVGFIAGIKFALPELEVQLACLVGGASGWVLGGEATTEDLNGEMTTAGEKLLCLAVGVLWGALAVRSAQLKGAQLKKYRELGFEVVHYVQNGEPMLAPRVKLPPPRVGLLRPEALKVAP